MCWCQVWFEVYFPALTAQRQQLSGALMRNLFLSVACILPSWKEGTRVESPSRPLPPLSKRSRERKAFFKETAKLVEDWCKRKDEMSLALGRKESQAFE